MSAIIVAQDCIAHVIPCYFCIDQSMQIKPACVDHEGEHFLSGSQAGISCVCKLTALQEPFPRSSIKPAAAWKWEPVCSLGHLRSWYWRVQLRHWARHCCIALILGTFGAFILIETKARWCCQCHNHLLDTQTGACIEHGQALRSRPQCLSLIRKPEHWTDRTTAQHH